MTEAAEPQWLTLYREAFERFALSALWNSKQLDQPTPEHARVIARQLQTRGDMRAWRHAARLKVACDAA